MGKEQGLVFAALGLMFWSFACDSASSKKKPSCAAEACDAGTTDAGTTDAAMPDAATPDAGKTVRTVGRVFDANSAAALSEARVSIAKASASTDGAGAFAMKSPPAPGGAVLALERDGYVPSERRAPGDGGYVEVFLKKVDQRVPFRGDAGVNVRLPNGAGIDIPSGAVRDSKGKRIAGEVTLELADVDGRVRTQAAALPGDAHATLLDGTQGAVSIQRALSIRILDDEGTELTVDPAADVVALMPSARPDSPFSEHAYSFDEASGAWKEESMASQLTRDGVRAYHVAVEHLSWWAVGRFFKTQTCVRACVEAADGGKVAGAQVWIVGASQAGVTAFFTDEDGCGASDTVANAEVVLVGQYLDSVSAPKKLSSGNTSASVSKNPAACTDGGTLVLKGEKASECPAGFSACGPNCVDLASDAQHCGACGNACDLGDTCVLDSCVAPEAEKISVRGKYLDRYGLPYGGLLVQIGSETQTTMADGSFAFDDVSVPYDLKIVRGDPELYMGLTRPDPEIRNHPGQAGNSAVISGFVSGGVGFPLPADHQTNVSFVGPTNINFNAIRRAGEDGNWGLPSRRLTWSQGFGALMGGVFAIQHNTATDVVTGMAYKDFTIEDGQTLTSPTLDLVLQPVTPHEVTFEVVLPNGMVFDTYVLSIGMFSQVLSSPPTTTFSLNVPDELPDSVPALFSARGSIGELEAAVVRYLDASVRSVKVELPMPAVPVAPAAAATNVPRSAGFEFDPQKGTITAINLSWTEGADGKGIAMYAGGRSVSFARLSVLGITPRPDDGTLDWGVEGDGPAGDMDERFAPGRKPFPDTLDSYSPPQTFTFAP